MISLFSFCPDVILICFCFLLLLSFGFTQCALRIIPHLFIQLPNPMLKFMFIYYVFPDQKSYKAASKGDIETLSGYHLERIVFEAPSALHACAGFDSLVSSHIPFSLFASCTML